MEYDDTKVTLFLMNVKINIVCMMCIFFLLSYVLFVNEREKWHFFQVSHIGSVIYYKFILCILKTELFCDLHILFFTTCASSLERFFKNTLWLTSCVICSFFHELCVFLKHQNFSCTHFL